MMIFSLLLAACAQQQVQTLTPSDPDIFDQFGSAIAIDGDVAIIGAHDKTIQGLNHSGAAYIFRRVGGVWSEEAKLLPLVSEIHDNFGTAVDIQGDVAIVGAPDFAVSSFNGTGRVWVYRHSAGTWNLEQELVPSTAFSDSSTGRALTLDGNTIVTSSRPWPLFSPNVAAVFEYNGSSWNETAIISTPSGAQFATRLELEGDRLAISAPYEDVGSVSTVGAVYVYERSAGAWSQMARIVPSSPSDSEFFGSDIGLEGDVIAIGAAHDDAHGIQTAGRIDVFRKQAGTWTLEQNLESSWPQNNASLGLHLSLDQGKIFASSEFSSSGSPHTSGAAHLYQQGAGGEWLGGSPIYPSVNNYNGFGFASAISGNTAMVGVVRNQVRVFDLEGGFRLNGVEADSQLASDNTNQLRVTGGQPNTMTWLAFSLTGFGSRNIAQLGIIADLNNPSPMGSAQLTDSSGNATWTFFIPAIAEEESAWWQAVQLGAKSNGLGTFVR